MLSRWAFRFLLFYICVLYTQPQNRFLFLYPLHIADLAVLAAIGLHFLSATQDGRPMIKTGPATCIALVLLLFGLVAQYAGPLQTNTAWNGYIDQLVKSVLVLVLVEAMAYSVQRVWAIQATILLCSLWWIKAGLRLTAAGAYYSGDRIMGPAVSLAENPNGFAYMMCVIIPIYLYFYQQWGTTVYQQGWSRLLKWGFLACALAGVYIVFQTGSRTGMMVLIVMGGFLVFRYFWHYKLAMAIASVAVVLSFGATGALNVQRFKSIPKSIASYFNPSQKDPSQMDQDEQSAFERAMKNKHSWQLIMAYPILGTGMNPNEARYPAGLWAAQGQVHNELLMAGRQMGLFGMAFYVALLLNMYRHGKHAQLAAANWWPAACDLGWTFKLQAIVFFVGGTFSPLPWNAPMFILAGAASALRDNLLASAAQDTALAGPADSDPAQTAQA